MSLRALIPVLTVALVVIGAPTASAQNCEAPPGTAAVEQYCEAIPEGAGSQSGNDFRREATESASGQGTSGSSGSPLPADVTEALDEAGRDGAAVAELARASRTTSGDGAGSAGAAGDVAGATAESDEPSGSPLKAISAAVQSGPVAGSLLVWTLLGATIGIAGLGWVRFRRHH